MKFFKRAKKIYFEMSNFGFGVTKCRHQIPFTNIGSPFCCIQCEYNKGYDLAEKWVKCTKGE